MTDNEMLNKSIKDKDDVVLHTLEGMSDDV